MYLQQLEKQVKENLPWVELYLLKRDADQKDADVLTPRAYDCDLMWKRGLRRCTLRQGHA